MKAIIVIITMLLLALDISVPDNYLFNKLKKKQVVTCSIAYDEDAEGYIYQDSVAHCTVVEIRNLPPSEEGQVNLKARFIKGSYSLKVATGLGLETGYDYVIEDQLTGQTYNLRTQPGYNFNVTRTIPDRFVMQVKKTASVSSK